MRQAAKLLPWLMLLPRSLFINIVLSSLVASGAGGQMSGTVEGNLAGGFAGIKRVAPRYPAGTAAAKGMQRVQPVVYLAGEALRSVPGGAGGDRAATVEIVQRDTAFAPSAIAVRSGTLVRFSNADPFFHNVFSYARNARFDLGRYPQGESREVLFEKEGIARVFCEIHEFMRAVVLVTDHPFGTVADEDGSFRFENVPVGEYTLTAYHPDLGLVQESITVGRGESVRVELRLGP